MIKRVYAGTCGWVFNCSVTHSTLCDHLWTVGAPTQAPLFMGFPRQEYWSGLLFSPPGDLPNPGSKLASPVWAGGFFTTEPPRKPYMLVIHI